MSARIRIRDEGGTLRTVSRIRMRDETGVLRLITRIRVRDTSNVLRTVFQYFTIDVSPTSITETASTPTIETGVSATASVTGGSAPFTYVWINSLGDPIQATTPSSATTTFRKTSTLRGDSYLAEFVCQVTDALGTTLETAPVTVSISRT